LNETDSGVTVRVTNASGFEAVETVSDRDQILQKSKAMGFAKKNKMRFHGIRMVINFHLAHLFSSLSDMFVEEYHDQNNSIEIGSKKVESVGLQKEKDRIIAWINNAKTFDTLRQVDEVVSSMQDAELTNLYIEKEGQLEEYGLCMTEIEKDVESLNNAEEINTYLCTGTIAQYAHVLTSEEDALRLVETRAKALDLKWNIVSMTFEAATDEKQ
jgi:hypothetical protein